MEGSAAGTVRVIAATARRWWMLLVMSAVVAACGPAGEQADVAREIAQGAADAGPGAQVDLADWIPGGFDVAYAFGGYSTNAEVHELIESWPSDDESMVPYDSRVLLVWLRSDAVAGWTILNRDDPPAAVRFSSYRTPIHNGSSTFELVNGGLTVGGERIFVLTQ